MPSYPNLETIKWDMTLHEMAELLRTPERVLVDMVKAKKFGNYHYYTKVRKIKGKIEVPMETSIRFTKASYFHYLCEINPDMKAQAEAEAAKAKAKASPVALAFAKKPKLRKGAQ